MHDLAIGVRDGNSVTNRSTGPLLREAYRCMRAAGAPGIVFQRQWGRLACHSQPGGIDLRTSPTDVRLCQRDRNADTMAGEVHLLAADLVAHRAQGLDLEHQLNAHRLGHVRTPSDRRRFVLNDRERAVGLTFNGVAPPDDAPLWMDHLNDCLLYTSDAA